MQLYLYTSVFVSFVISVWTYTVPNAVVEMLKPKGFRISIPHEDGITQVSFNLTIDQPITNDKPADFGFIISEPTKDRWEFDNINTNIKPGNKIFYGIHVQFGKSGDNFRESGTTIVSADSVESTNICSDAGQSTKQECPATDKLDCELSATTVGRRPVCKGQLIFEDNFDSLDWTKWDREVRIPLDSDDGPFVSFQSRPQNCYADNGQLHITPTLQSEVMNVVTDKLDLTAECTGIVDRSLECQRQAQNFRILPPIISARICTKDSFTFRFGKIEIRAKLPKGDWLFPLILLEPLENYYGMRNYASGQIRIAFNRGNAVLVDKNAKDISSQWLYGGVVMNNDDKFREVHLGASQTSKDLSDDFHTYTLIWKEDRCVVSIDGSDYAVLNENYSQLQRNYHGFTNMNHKMAPFDREFFLTLGLSAGGHSDFPDGCRTGNGRRSKPWNNNDPKAELDFWNDNDDWYPTWEPSPSSLHVDYVRVYAL